MAIKQTSKRTARRRKVQTQDKAQAKAQDTSALDLISFDDAAQMLGTSRRTVERLVEREQLHTFKKKFGVGQRSGRLPRLLDRAEVQAIVTSAQVIERK